MQMVLSYSETPGMHPMKRHTHFLAVSKGNNSGTDSAAGSGVQEPNVSVAIRDSSSKQE